MTFDWTTFAFQLVNVLILLAILRHFLFRPVAAIIARRQADTQAAMDAAASARAEAEAATARAAAEAAASAAARADVLAAATAEAEGQRARILANARAEADRIIAEGRAVLARETVAEHARSLAQLRDLAAAIAARALADQPRDTEGYVTRLADALAAQDPAMRAALLGGGHLAIVAPADLPPPLQGRLRDLLAGYGATAAFATDPALIAGVELRSDSGALRNSLAHDLAQITKAMQDERTPT